MFERNWLGKLVLFISIRLPVFICILDKLSNIDLCVIPTVSKFYRNDHRALLHEDSTNNIMKFKIWRVGNHLPVWRPGIHFCNVTASNKNHKASFSLDNGEKYSWRNNLSKNVFSHGQVTENINSVKIIIGLLYTLATAIITLGHYDAEYLFCC